MTGHTTFTRIDPDNVPRPCRHASSGSSASGIGFRNALVTDAIEMAAIRPEVF